MCFVYLFSLIGVEWGLHFPAANGEYQSPINLNSREAQYDPSLLDVGLSPNYVVCRDCEVINDGHTVRIILRSKSGESQETCQYSPLIDLRRESRTHGLVVTDTFM